jgi:hypothetical protein
VARWGIAGLRCAGGRIAGAKTVRAAPAGGAGSAGKFSTQTVADVAAVDSTVDCARCDLASIDAGALHTHAADTGGSRRTISTVELAAAAVSDDAAVLATRHPACREKHATAVEDGAAIGKAHERCFEREAALRTRARPLPYEKHRRCSFSSTDSTTQRQ